MDNTARAQRLGETLLIHALRSAQRAAKIVEIYAVVVDAFDESARSFYLKYGFNELTDDRLHLYMPMEKPFAYLSLRSEQAQRKK